MKVLITITHLPPRRLHPLPLWANRFGVTGWHASQTGRLLCYVGQDGRVRPWGYQDGVLHSRWYC